MQSNLMIWTLLILSVVFAQLRISGEKGEFFQAMAHVFVGILIGLGCIRTPSRWLYWGLAIGLSAIEVVVAILQAKGVL
jgi:hypothetical protein